MIATNLEKSDNQKENVNIKCNSRVIQAII